MSASTIPARLFEQAAQCGDSPAYAVRDPDGWKTTSWSTYGDEVRQAARALLTLGLSPGDTVCILGFNRPEWVILDVAAMAIGAIPAGIYTTCSSSEIQYIIDHAEASVLLLENSEQWAKVQGELERMPKLRHVVMMRGATVDDSMVMDWETFLSRGDETETAVVEERLLALKDDDLATFIYTSGTTGPPKAVMLTHKNLAWTAELAVGMANMNSDFIAVSYLPLSHIAEQVFSIHAPITAGSSVYFAQSLEKLPENLQEVQPTVFFGVPRVWEKFYAKLTTALAGATGVKAKLLGWSMGVGRKVIALENEGRQPGPLLAAQHRIADRLLGKVRTKIGLGNVKFCVTGAAPISQEILEFFSGLGLAVREVYGQSEDTGPTSINLEGATRFGSVGRPLEGVEVRIAEDGEICVRGPNVFAGYYKDPAATADALQDGWLLSGDLGELDSDGYLHITGRKKDILITAGGKNIAPKNIELSLTNHPLIGQAVVIGDRRKFLSALLTVDEDAGATFAKDKGIDSAALSGHSELQSELQSAVDEVNAQFARVEHIRKFTVLTMPFSLEAGELTPTMKIKRKVVNERYATQIDAMYQ